MNKKVIGILGGMGPDSSALFYQEVLSEFQKLTHPKFDQDYPEIFLYNLPISDPVSGIENPDELITSLTQGIKKLELVGVDFISIPCNTVHLYLDEMRKSTDVPILSIIEETLREVKWNNITKVGLLATGVTVKNKIYHKIFEKENIVIRIPEKQDAIDIVIHHIVAGDHSENDKNTLLKTIQELQSRGVNTII